MPIGVPPENTGRTPAASSVCLSTRRLAAIGVRFSPSNRSDATLSGVVEIDGAYVGGHTRRENKKADRKDRRLSENQSNVVTPGLSFVSATGVPCRSSWRARRTVWRLPASISRRVP